MPSDGAIAKCAGKEPHVGRLRAEHHLPVVSVTGLLAAGDDAARATNAREAYSRHFQNPRASTESGSLTELR